MQRAVSFTVPAGAGTYAPEVIYLSADSDPTGGTPASMDDVYEMDVLIESLPATAVIEVDLLRPKGNPSAAGDWIIAAVASYNAIGNKLQALLKLAKRRGVRIRAKSGGTAGAAVVSASWWEGPLAAR